MPDSLSRPHTEWIQFRDGLEFALDSSQDAHWLLDYGTYNEVVAWGPIPAAQLEKLKLLDRIQELSGSYIREADHNSEVEGRIGALVRCENPLAAIGLAFIPTMSLPNPPQSIPSDSLERTIRDRRVKLEEMGLAVPTQRALDILTANAPPMPTDSQFTVVSSTEIPLGLNEAAWGPVNAGLQAAALMPQSLLAEKTSNVQLFIRNVSEHDVRLAVSQRGGYDYATVVNAEGDRLLSFRPLIFPSAFASVIAPELNPGQTGQQPPTATLLKILLRPQAVLQLAPKTGLCFHLPDKPTGPFHTSPRDNETPAVTHISAVPTTAWVTWHLHTANGAIYSSDARQRLWPARGSWSGILTTAPVKIQLRP